MNKKLILGIVIAFTAFIVIVGGIALAVVLPIKDYVDRTPTIVPNTPITAESGDTLSVSDLCTVECKGDFTLSLVILESQVSDAYVSQDGQTLHVGSETGIITVSVVGRGDNAESRSEKAQIYVNIDLD
ncbi:MAG: hypothetical protein IJ336_08280 [Lachnospiraceae bacterium]|nr:hypothetical protein [Lachnospiraceae bacterium]